MEKQQREIEDLKQQVEVLQERLRMLGEQGEDTARDYMDAFRRGLHRASDVWRDNAGEIKDRAVKAGKRTDEYVHENAWQVAGIAAVAGLLLGALIRRSRD